MTIALRAEHATAMGAEHATAMSAEHATIIEPANEARNAHLTLTLFGTDAARLPAVPGLGTLTLAGTGLLSSECGTSAFSVTATLRCHRSANGLTLRNALFAGRRVSGYDAGPVEITLMQPETVPSNGAFHTTATLYLADANNAALPIEVTLHGVIADEVLQELTAEGNGAGFCFAEFLADGESLDEEE